MSKTVIIAGATGFVGAALAKRLVYKQYDVVALVRELSDARLPKELRRISIGNDASHLRSKLEGSRGAIVVNCAALGVRPEDRDPKKLFDVNAALPVQLVEAAAHNECLGIVHLGTMSEHLPTETHRPIKETAPLDPSSPYGSTKAAGTLALTACAKAYGLSSIALRCFAGYGPGESENRLLPSLHRALAVGDRFAMNTGQIVRDFIDIDSIVSGVIAAIERVAQPPQINTICNLGTGRGITLRAFVETYCEVAKLDASLIDYGAFPLRDTDAPYSVADMARTGEVLPGFKATDTEEALSIYAAHLQT